MRGPAWSFTLGAVSLLTAYVMPAAPGPQTVVTVALVLVGAFLMAVGGLGLAFTPDKKR